MRLIGIDPGLQRTGWGVIDVEHGRLRYVDCGVVASQADKPLAERLETLFEGLRYVIACRLPFEAAIEETVVNKNALSSLKLGHARGAAMLAASTAGLTVAEYASKTIKRAVVGTGAATKDQMMHMIGVLLPGAAGASADAADALAVAVCHANRTETNRRMAAQVRAGA